MYHACVSIWSLDRYAPESRRAIGLDVAASVIALALLLLVAVDFSAPLRLVLALLFTFYVPGRAIVSNWPRMERWSAIGMSIVFSLGLLALLAMVSLWAGLWHPLALFLAESLASLVALALSLARRHQAGNASRNHFDATARYADPEQASSPRGVHGMTRFGPGQPAGPGQAETLTWPPAEDRRTEDLRPPEDNRRTEVLSWLPAEDKPTKTPPWPPTEGKRTEAPSWPVAEDKQIGTPPWPRGESRDAGTSPWPPTEDRVPTFRPRQPAKDTPPAQAPAESPAEDGAPKIHSRRSEEDSQGGTLAWPPAEDRVPTFHPRQPAKDTPAQGPRAQPAEDKHSDVPLWQPAKDAPAQASEEPPAEDEPSHLQSWQPAEDEPAQDRPADDKLPEIQPRQPKEDGATGS